MSIKEKLRQGLIVSCQALPGEPLYQEDTTLMHLMAKAAVEAGAVGIRANSVRDIKRIKETVDVPVIGIIKIDYDDSDIYITPTMKEVDELVEVHCDIIALDCTKRMRPGNIDLETFIKAIKEKYPTQLFMADVSTFEEGQVSHELGIDFIGTTLAGYTPYSKNVDGPNFELIKQLVEAGFDVIAEGKIYTPEQCKAIMDLNVFACVVGGAITRPKEITSRFIKALKK